MNSARQRRAVNCWEIIGVPPSLEKRAKRKPLIDELSTKSAAVSVGYFGCGVGRVADWFGGVFDS